MDSLLEQCGHWFFILPHFMFFIVDIYHRTSRAGSSIIQYRVSANSNISPCVLYKTRKSFVDAICDLVLQNFGPPFALFIQVHV